MKRIITLLLASCLCVGLCACGNGESTTTESTTMETALQTEPPKTIPPTTEEPETVPPTTKEPTEPPVQVESIELSETITIQDKCEFTIAAIDWGYDLRPRLNSYSSILIAEAKDGAILCYLKITYKNLENENFGRYSQNNYGKWKATLTYDGQYNYNAREIADAFPDFENGLTPLMSGDIYIVFELPESFETDGKELTVSLDIFDNLYEFALREPEETQ